MKKIKKPLIGLFAGIISGLFAAGGGLILVPAFIYLLNMEDRKARGTAVCSILPMVITSSIFYNKQNYIDWKIGISCAIGGIIGGVIGAKLLYKVPTKYIRMIFTVFLLYVGILFISKNEAFEVYDSSVSNINILFISLKYFNMLINLL